MKKTHSKEELQAKADKVLAQYPKEDKVYATADGNVFLSENHATRHAGPIGKVFTFLRQPEEKTETAEPAKKHDMNAADTAKAVMAVQTVEELLPFADDDRKTVITAIEKRKAELEAVSQNPDA